MSEGTKVISLADAMARIDVLESRVAMLFKTVRRIIDVVDRIPAVYFADLETRLSTDAPSATQVAEAS